MVASLKFCFAKLIILEASFRIQDKTVAEIEARIAEATGIWQHGHEEALYFNRIGAIAQSEGYVSVGLHHDTNRKPFRARTMIIYLADVASGGHTIFPLCTADEDSAMLHDLREALVHNWKGARDNFERSIDTEEFRGSRIEDLLTAACAGKHGVSIVPRRGSAVMFDSILANGRPNPLTWHGGCDVLKGTKITAQKFKTTPIEARPRIPYG